MIVEAFGSRAHYDQLVSQLKDQVLIYVSAFYIFSEDIYLLIKEYKK